MSTWILEKQITNTEGNPQDIVSDLDNKIFYGNGPYIYEYDRSTETETQIGEPSDFGTAVYMAGWGLSWFKGHLYCARDVSNNGTDSHDFQVWKLDDTWTQVLDIETASLYIVRALFHTDDLIVAIGQSGNGYKSTNGTTWSECTGDGYEELTSLEFTNPDGTITPLTVVDGTIQIFYGHIRLGYKYDGGETIYHYNTDSWDTEVDTIATYEVDQHLPTVTFPDGESFIGATWGGSFNILKRSDNFDAEIPDTPDTPAPSSYFFGVWPDSMLLTDQTYTAVPVMVYLGTHIANSFMVARGSYQDTYSYQTTYLYSYWRDYTYNLSSYGVAAATSYANTYGITYAVMYYRSTASNIRSLQWV